MSSAFSALGVSADLTACLDRLGISSPYPIQSATLPDALSGKDVFAQSPTGSGKTLAFAIPLVSRIGNASARRPRGLVLAPTRELAAQIADAIRPLARSAHREVAAVYGGASYKGQIDSLRRGVDIIVGCPGRLIDLADRVQLRLRDVEVVVVDEADRMADMGFLPSVRQLLDSVNGPRQTMLFSATVSKEVERLVRDYQSAPVRHLLSRPADDVSSRSHEFWRAPREHRAGLTAGLVGAHGSSIVFCRTKRGVDRLARQLNQAGVPAVAIHGDRSQAQRERALAQFRSGHAQVLVGTDVASRGIHVEGVDCVVHFDPPEDSDTYVHRSGRTGRAGSSGRVVSLVCPDQERGAKRLVANLGLETSLIASPEQQMPAARQPQAQRPAATPRQVTGGPKSGHKVAGHPATGSKNHPATGSKKKRNPNRAKTGSTTFSPQRKSRRQRARAANPTR